MNFDVQVIVSMVFKILTVSNQLITLQCQKSSQPCILPPGNNYRHLITHKATTGTATAAANLSATVSNEKSYPETQQYTINVD